jgi:hypothetical protein
MRFDSAMKATPFEYRHQTLVHQSLVAAAFLTYIVDPEDIVWRFVKNTSAPHTWERASFIAATLLIAAGTIVCTWTRTICPSWANKSQSDLHRFHYLGELVYAIGLGSLAPLWGFIILVVGEAIRLFRLMRFESEEGKNAASRHRPPSVASGFRKAIRKEAVKWGIFFTMIVFVVTLKDRLAEALAVASFLAGLLLNAPSFRPSSNSQKID